MSIDQEVQALIDAKVQPVSAKADTNTLHLQLVDADLADFLVRLEALEGGTTPPVEPPVDPPEQPAGTVYDAPPPTGGNDTPTIQNFIDSLPNGTAANPTLAVFPLATYRFDSWVNIRNKAYVYVYGMDPALVGDELDESIPRTRIDLPGSSEAASGWGIGLVSGITHDVKLIGFRIVGTHTGTTLTGKSKGIYAFSPSGQYGIEVAHNILEDIWSASIYFRTQDNPGWDDVDIHHNAIYRSGIMGIAVSNGTSIRIRDNRIIDTNLYPVDLEDETAPTFLEDIYIERNEITDWGRTNAYPGPLAITSWSQLDHTNIYVRDNVISGSYPTTYDQNWDHTRGIIDIRPGGFSGSGPGVGTNIVVSGNVVNTAHDGVQVIVRKTNGVAVTDNTFTGSTSPKDGAGDNADTVFSGPGSTNVVVSGNVVR